jgi:hypothetical protein
MNIGMMWFDNDPKTSLATKIARAAEYYRAKYGRTPDICLVNPNTTIGEVMGNITIRSCKTILPGHLWIGVEDVEVRNHTEPECDKSHS